MKGIHAKLKNIGEQNIPFFASTLLIKNEVGKHTGILMVSFNKAAIKHAELPSDSLETVYARLCPVYGSGRFELSVNESEIHRKEGSNYVNERPI